ncbi:MAG: dTDP-4-dehydrorhamnose 3,5-epimerase family protein [Bacteroidia bacterium]
MQDNLSSSTKGVIRGLHFQNPLPRPGQTRECARRRCLDVAVDIRQGSLTTVSM